MSERVEGLGSGNKRMGVRELGSEDDRVQSRVRLRIRG
jgi:hypothetical protein